jgi:hypothetical protein
VSAGNVMWKAAVKANCHREKSSTVWDGPAAVASASTSAPIIGRQRVRR